MVIFLLTFQYTSIDTPLRYTILIDPQIVFNIEELICTICELITIVYLNKCIGTH
jgi:hypothetical protein